MVRKRLKILSSGVFYTPIDTPAHKKGWWAEIVFLNDPTNRFYINRPPISHRFATKAEAEKSLNYNKMKLYMAREYYVKETTNEEIRQSIPTCSRPDNDRA